MKRRVCGELLSWSIAQVLYSVPLGGHLLWSTPLRLRICSRKMLHIDRPQGPLKNGPAGTFTQQLHSSTPLDAANFDDLVYQIERNLHPSCYLGSVITLQGMTADAEQYMLVRARVPAQLVGRT